MTRFLPKTLRFYLSQVILAFVIVMALVTSFLPSTASVVEAQDEPTVPSSITVIFPADNGSLGAIPDATGCHPAINPTPRNVTFTVTGLSGTPTNVEVSMTTNPAHTWVGDLTATLIAPNAASHVLFGRTGATTDVGAGDNSDFAGPYDFKDGATGTNWWTAATAAGAAVPVAAGDYRSTPRGGAGATNPPLATTITTAFSGVTNPNGTWTLRVTDDCNGDIGDISFATLTITAGPAIARRQNVDFDGDGRSDWAITRATTPVSWYIHINGSAANSVAQHGNPTDTPVPSDYDGDGRADIAVWRPGTQGAFYILRSTNGTVDIVPFGQTGDDAKVVGDYDGDLKADVAVYRPGATSGAQGFFFFKGTNNNPSGNITYVPWGAGPSVTPNPGDFDGDGKHDFCLRRDAGGGVGQFVLLRSSNFSVEYITWGQVTDTIVPGDYDNDGSSDFMVVRTSGGVRNWYLLERDGTSTGFSPVFWGLPADIIAPGDYDADGRQDIAIWRPTDATFWVRRSSDGTLQTFQFGVSSDYPAANWYVH